MIFDWQYLFDALKKQGLTAILLGAYIWFQQRDIDKMKEEQEKRNQELKEKVHILEMRLIDCDKARIEDLKNYMK